MSAKSMFLRMFRRTQASASDAMSWLIETSDKPTHVKPDGDAASIPMSMRKADPGEIPSMDDTAILPVINVHTERVVYELESASDDDEFCTRAAAALKLGSWQDVFAGLNRYFALHPTAQEPVAA